MPRSKNDVKWVSDTIGRGAYEYAGFIKKYFSEYENIQKSLKKINEDGNPEPGKYFNNFIETCRNCLLSNRNYYHYNIDAKICIPLSNPGPTRQYSELLKYIVINSRTFDKDDARKIHNLLFWFEQQGITFLMVVPLHKTAKDIFETYQVLPGYFEQKDGTMNYCSTSGIRLENGMEISNTRVNALLNKIHELGDDDDDQDGGFRGKLRAAKKTKCHGTSYRSIRRTYRRRSSSKRTRRRNRNRH